ncbi:MAG: hypothetical protein LBC02_09950, partial [Planctomycetaceae bacterium]|nr:hypothetical protein [Planctomycetaceae bacterium]
MTTSTDHVTEPKKRRIPYLYLLLFLSALLTIPALYLACLYVPPLRISEETTRITEPLTSDRQIDFLRYLEETMYPPEWATDDNGYRIFVRNFGGMEGKSNLCKEQLYQKLGLDVHVPPTMTLPEEPSKIISDYYTKRGETLPPEKFSITAKPWTLEELPMLADWVVAIDAPLDAVTEMIRKPIFFCPFIQDDESYRTG